MKTNRLDDQMNALVAVAIIAITALAAFDVGQDHYFGRSGDIKLTQAAAQTLHARNLHDAQPAQAVAASKPLAVVAAR